MSDEAISRAAGHIVGACDRLTNQLSWHQEAMSDLMRRAEALMTSAVQNPVALPESPLYIVAEISKNWMYDGGVEPEPLDGDASLVSKKFEEVLAVNHQRGYDLVSHSMTSTMTGSDLLNETIIAVFKRR